MGYTQLQLDTTAAKTIFGTYGHRAYKYRTGGRISNLSIMPRIIVLKYQKDMSKHFFFSEKALYVCKRLRHSNSIGVWTKVTTYQ